MRESWGRLRPGDFMDEDGHTLVVLHADLDCFYAVVEQVRLGIPTEQPLAVQQWEGLIAVNYVARAAGIMRHERVSEVSLDVRLCVSEGILLSNERSLIGKDLVKSMLASKSFGATNDPSDIRKWVLVFAQELAIRMRRDFEMNQRQPKLFQLYYRTRKFKTSADHSRSVGMPPSALQILSSPAYSDLDGDVNIEIKHRSGVELSTEDGGVDVEVQGDLSELRGDSTVEDALDGGVEGGITERTKALAKALEDTSLRLLESVDGLFPCTRLAIAATGFRSFPTRGRSQYNIFLQVLLVAQVHLSILNLHHLVKMSTIFQCQYPHLIKKLDKSMHFTPSNTKQGSQADLVNPCC